MTKGRKPAPSEIKELQGTAQPCRINKFEPKVNGRITDMLGPPDYLSEEAKCHWKFILDHEGGGWIKQCDLAMFETYCEQWAELVRYRRERKRLRVQIEGAEKKIEELRAAEKYSSAISMIKFRDELWERDNFLANLIVKCIQPFKSVASELGFTPSSRSRVIATGETPGQVDTKTLSLFDDKAVDDCLSEVDYRTVT